MNILLFNLPWWAAVLLWIYAIYTLIRAYVYFCDGVKNTFSITHTVKLYHLLWMVIDIPAIVFGKLYHIFKFLFNIPVIPLKREEKNGRRIK